MTRIRLSWLFALLGFSILCMRLVSFFNKITPSSTAPFRKVINPSHNRLQPLSSLASMGKLSEFLVLNKAKFLEDVKSDKTGEWTVVMGNEAGDLDSVASSIAYAYLASTLRNQPTIALLQTPRGDLYLRPENLYTFRITGLDAENRDLLCIDDLPPSIKLTRIALVDHNRLNPSFEGENVKVVAVIDHHVDEGLYKDAEVRDIQLVGSGASLVARNFQSLWKDEVVPPEVATLLLSAVFLDTDGLKPDDKAVEIDHAAARFLSPHSNLPAEPEVVAEGQEPGPSLGTLEKTLSKYKKDISDLSTRDLLRRDYKQWTWGGLATGLSTVPFGLKDWMDKDDKFWEALDAYMDERKLSILGVLTTFKQKKEKRREVAFLLHREVSQELEKKLWDGLEASEVLELEKKKKVEVQGNRRARLWNQGNIKATRKQIAPLVQGIVEGVNSNPTVQSRV